MAYQSNESDVLKVQKFYAAKTIFITGVTGFLGRVLLFKLLYSCPDLNRIYVLIRNKKNQNIHQRFQKLMNDPIFDKIRKRSPNYERIVKPIQGDCIQPNLGISKINEQVIVEETNIIFHAAAIVKFDACLRDATYMNVRSTSDLLDMANRMKNLEAFVYISTVFSPCAGRKLIEERFYDAPITAEKLLSLVEHFNDQDLDRITPLLLKPHPNTYVYTKLVAETLCRDKGSNIPISIFRPAIVISSMKEPVAGYINNLYGTTGVAFSYLMGILKVIFVDERCRADNVPCDYVINALIVSTYRASSSWSQSENENTKHHIFNYSNTTTKFSFTWGTVKRECFKAFAKYPFSKSVSYPFMMCIKTKMIYRFLIILFHLLPATIMDLILIVRCQNSRYVKTYNKIHKLVEVLAFFIRQEWTIPNNNIDKLWNQLSPKEKEIFYFNLNEINISECFDIFINGIRKFQIKDTDQDLPRARAKFKKLKRLYYSFICFLILFSSWSVATIISNL